ncbi:MAG: magnesium/cobalt transporter CorA [Nitrospinae bacterium]|nr:magnesium/cobalt transporter CorA [Nitrospinota bacterium]
MPRLTKKRSKKAGLPPGTLVHIGEKKAEEVKITIMGYNDGHFEEKEIKTIQESRLSKDKSTITWVNVEGIHQVGIVEEVGNYFGLHPLVLEDILNTDQRPKIDDYDKYIYIVLKMIYFNGKCGEIVTEQISLILGSNFVISFQEGKEGDVFDPIRERIRNGKGRIRTMGADYLGYTLLDAIVDNYFIVLEKLGENIELLEEELVVDPTTQTLREIHRLKREMIFLRKAVWPLREVISSLERGESSLIKETMEMYFRDVHDHAIYVIETIETFRDMLSGMLDIYLSSINNKMNAVMKVLTIVMTIFMPLSLIAGIYGMNFKYMPELEWRWGYFMACSIMGVIGVSMVVYFRKKRWL